MKSLTFALALWFGAAVAVGRAHAANPEAPNARPNVILVFIDDMGWADFSCFGNTDAQTPNVDRLAAEGLAFEQFYVNSPICSPSRTAISTGQYPQRWLITSYLAHHGANHRRGMADWLDPDAPMLARTLREAGYATGHFGKWHMGGQRDVDAAPPINAYGFDAALTNFEGMGAKLLPLTLKPGDDKPGRIWTDAERLGQPVTWTQRSQITGGFVDAALGFIKRAEADSKPFYVNVWPDDVHAPFFPPVENWGDGSKRTLYLAVLEALDRQLGPLFDHVRNSPALRDNTLILVCSDNGPDPGAGSAGPFRGTKATLYEGGVRSPLVVWAPGLMKKDAVGTRNRASVFAAFDLVPSLIEICGAQVPAGVEYDGEQLAPTLLGESTASRRAPIFFSRPPDRKDFGGMKSLPDLGVRAGRWKLLCDYDGGRARLHDLDADPGERNDVSAAHPDVTRRLVDATLDWWRRMPTADAPAQVEPSK